MKAIVCVTHLQQIDSGEPWMCADHPNGPILMGSDLDVHLRDLTE